MADSTTFTFEGKTYSTEGLTENQMAVLEGLAVAEEQVKEADQKLQLFLIARDSLISDLKTIISSLDAV